MGVAITLRGLSHTYRTAEGPLTVLGGLDLDVADGGYAAITGPSGAGKTTLLSLLGGLEPPQEGSSRSAARTSPASAATTWPPTGGPPWASSSSTSGSWRR